MSKTASAAFLAHLASEAQTRCVIWALKLNYRRINVTAITQASNAQITTNESHTLSVDDYVALDNVVGMVEINDAATGTWAFHRVASIVDANNFTIDTDTTAFTAYTSGGIVHEAFGFTTNVVDLTRDGLLYRAETAFSPTATHHGDKLNIPTIEMEGVLLPLLSTEGISEDDIAGGRLDYAEVRVQTVNYEDLSMGGMWMGRGYIGKITVKNDQYIAELRGLSQIGAQNILELYSPGCRYDLGSRRCKVDITGAPFFVTGTVTTVVTDRIVIQDSARTEADDFFSQGQITFTSGNNSGLQMLVKSYQQTNGEMELWQPIPFSISPGDSYELVAGCDKQLATCRDKFDNLLNHGGFPHLPGEDQLAQVLVPKRPEVTRS